MPHWINLSFYSGYASVFRQRIKLDTKLLSHHRRTAQAVIHNTHFSTEMVYEETAFDAGLFKGKFNPILGHSFGHL